MYKIMVVEDEPLVVKAMTTLIDNKMENVEVVATADNGKSALEAFKKFHPDIILMDIQMPNMNGLEVSNRIKKIDPNISIIIITAYPEFSYAQKAIQINVDDYILKPARPDRIIESINKSINKLEESLMVKNTVFKLDKKEELEMNFLSGDYREINDQILDFFDIEEKDYKGVHKLKDILKKNFRALGENYSLNKELLKNIDYKLDIANSKGELINRYLEVSKEVFTSILDEKKKRDLEKNEIFISLQYIELNLNRDLRLDEVAEYVHISPSYYSKLFKKEMGINFVEYLRNRRINLSKLFLKNTNLSISEISVLSGFNESNYFSRVFKEKEGISPTKYRNDK